jgi:hypothetical protein
MNSQIGFDAVQGISFDGVIVRVFLEKTQRKLEKVCPGHDFPNEAVELLFLISILVFLDQSLKELGKAL